VSNTSGTLDKRKESSALPSPETPRRSIECPLTSDMKLPLNGTTSNYLVFLYHFLGEEPKKVST
jgi:hypothetical protein